MPEKAHPDADVRAILEDLKEAVDGDAVSPQVHDDDSNMTPMLVVEFDRTADRAEVMRQLFHAEGPVEVTGIYDYKVVVRPADRG